MASPVSGLTAVPNPTEGWVTLSWTNPGAGETSIAIEMKASTDTDWDRVYTTPQPVVATRKIRPRTLTPMSFRVATIVGSTLSSWVQIDNITLQGRTIHGYPVWLESTVDGSKVALGAGANLDNNTWQEITAQVTLQPPQATDPVFYFTRQETMTAQAFTFSVFNQEPLADGSGLSQYGDEIVATLRKFQRKKHRLLYRDNKIAEMYIYIWSVTVSPKAGIHQTVSFSPNRVQAPTIRLTS